MSSATIGMSRRTGRRPRMDAPFFRTPLVGTQRDARGCGVRGFPGGGAGDRRRRRRYWRPVRGYRYLYEQMVRRELRQKYKGSALGVLYYLINPLVLMVAYAIMTKYVLRFDAIDDYPLFLLIGIGTWLFFSQALLASASSLLDQSSLVRKVRFPREIIPAAVVSVQFVIFIVLIALLTPVTVAVRGSLDPALLLLPVVLVLLGAFALGLGLGLSVLHAYYRDVAPILSAALLPWFFISPIFFRTTDFPGLEEHPWLGDLLR